MDTLIHSLVAGTGVNTDDVAEKFVKALTEDGQKLERGEGKDISDCALHAPNLGTVVDKQFGIAHLIAKKCFADVTKDAGDSSSSSDIDKWQYILYKRLIRDLRKILRQRAPDGQKKRERKTAKSCQLHKDAPIGHQILEPAAMPVKIPPAEEFEPFFHFLELNQELGPDDGEVYPFVPNTRMLQFQRGAVYTDRRMDLCKQVVGPTHITSLMTSLRKTQQITHFLLGNNIIGRVGAEAIADYITDPQETRIKTWYLAGNDIDEEGMAVLAKALETDSFCQSLWLKRNPIKLGVRHLAQTLTVNRTIKILDLSNTGVFDEGAKILFEALVSNYSLRILYLDANGLSGKTAAYIVEYITKLEGRKGVTGMWLSMNRFYDDFIPAIKALGSYEHLKRLNVGSARLGPASAQALYEAFANHNRLKILEVGMYKATFDMQEMPNSMGDEGAKWLAKLIEENKSIQDLAVIGNGFTAVGYGLLARALVENKKIFYLDYRRELLDTEIKDSLRKSIKRNFRLYHGDSILTKANLIAFKKQLRHGKQILDIDSVYRNRAK